jgi:hypothetical protein
MVRNISSPRAVRSTSIEAATAMMRPAPRPAAVVDPALVPPVALDAPGPEPVEVVPHQRLLVGAAVVGHQAGAEEVGDVAERRPGGHGLPVDDGDRDATVLPAEQQVVEPVVAVDDRDRAGVRGDVVPEAGEQQVAGGGDVVVELVGVALPEAGVQRGQQLARDRPAGLGVAVQP